MGKKVFKLNEKQSKRKAADNDKRPSSAEWLKKGGREWQQEVHDLIDFTLNLFNDNEEYFEGRDSSIQQDPAVLILRLQQHRVQGRRRHAENCQKAERRIADVISGHGLPLCACSSREIVDVREMDLRCTLIDLNNWLSSNVIQFIT